MKLRPEDKKRMIDMGVNDFNNGARCVPAHSKDFMDSIKDYHIGDGRTSEASKLWVYGWTITNLACPIPAE